MNSDPDQPTSFAHANMLGDRTAFEAKFEKFLVSPETPVSVRRFEANWTIERLTQVVSRLRAQGVL